MVKTIGIIVILAVVLWVAWKILRAYAGRHPEKKKLNAALDFIAGIFKRKTRQT